MVLDRTFSNSASVRRTAANVIGAIKVTLLPCGLRLAFLGRSASSKNFRRAWAKHAASKIGPGDQSGSYGRIAATIWSFAWLGVGPGCSKLIGFIGLG